MGLGVHPTRARNGLAKRRHHTNQITKKFKYAGKKNKHIKTLNAILILSKTKPEEDDDLWSRDVWGIMGDQVFFTILFSLNGLIWEFRRINTFRYT